LTGHTNGFKRRSERDSNPSGEADRGKQETEKGRGGKIGHYVLGGPKGLGTLVRETRGPFGSVEISGEKKEGTKKQ